MNNKILVSIIVPVYNSEKFIKECIDSILNQSYKNIEVVIVNDGSSDNTAMICNEYRQKDERIKVVHQKNSGPSVARNNGIKNATGDFIQFVDSDDTIEKEMTEILVNEITDDVNLVISGFRTIKVIETKEIFEYYKPGAHGVKNKKGFLEIFGELHKLRVIASTCNKLYDRDIIKINNLTFIDELTIGEDLLFNVEFIRNCKDVSLVDEILYNYLIYNNSNSLTSDFKKDYFKMQQIIYNRINTFLIEENMYTEKNKYYLDKKFGENIDYWIENLFHRNSNLNSNEKKEEINLMLKNKTLRNNILNSNSLSKQKKVIQLLVKNNLDFMVYWLFKIKLFIRNRLSFLFKYIKKILK